jgi:hypothetical protein
MQIKFGRETSREELGSSCRRWEDNIKIDLSETGCEVVDYIQLAQDGVKVKKI